MENIILEMKKIVDDAKGNGLSFDKIRNELKEYLHYFVLDFIYNSEFKQMVFYGGSCLRVIYGLPRMSIDLDFEAEEGTDFTKLTTALEKYFISDLGLKGKFSVRGEKKSEYVNRVFLTFPLMNEIGLSAHKDEALKVRIDIMSVSNEYLKSLIPIFTLKSKYGKSFVIKHYDLPTLFASKLVAILDRPQRGFAVGKEEEEIDFKGRDFYDLIWYMEKGVLPNEKMLKLKGINGSVRDVFDEIVVFMSKRKLDEGLKRDLEPLFIAPIDNFVDSFRNNFQRLKAERYSTRKIGALTEITFDIDPQFDKHFFRFRYLSKDGTMISFLFKVSNHFYLFSEKGDAFNSMKLSKEDEAKINWKASIMERGQEISKCFMALFLSKINAYLNERNNEVYFTWWESKLIRMNEDNFNPEKEILFASGEELASNKKITLESLSL